jgi:hypothetical protein
MSRILIDRNNDKTFIVKELPLSLGESSSVLTSRETVESLLDWLGEYYDSQDYKRKKEEKTWFLNRGKMPCDERNIVEVMFKGEGGEPVKGKAGDYGWSLIDDYGIEYWRPVYNGN